MNAGEEFDIFPLGREEARPVTLQGSGNPADYPEAVCLIKGLDHAALLAEFINFEKREPARLLAERRHLLKRDLESVYKSLGELGFRKGVYSGLSMRRVGTCELLESVGLVTRGALESLGAPNFRQQYVIAEAGWRSEPHFDHMSFAVHGIRVHIPLSGPSVIAYPRPKGGETVYRMNPGEAWFINSGRLHYAFNPEPGRRVNIQVQLASDLGLSLNSRE